MSDNIAEHLEILVHSTASTTKKEDDRLRAQALACLGFQPAKTTPLADIIFTKNLVQLNEGGCDGIQKLRGSQTRSQTKQKRGESSQPLGVESKEQPPKFPRTIPTSPGSLNLENSPECISAQYPRFRIVESFF